MAEQDELTIEMEPVRGGREFGIEAERAQREDAAYRAAGLEPDASAVPADLYGIDTEQELIAFRGNKELVESTNLFLQRAAARADDDRNEELTKRQIAREQSAAAGGWIPGGATDAQRQKLRGDHARRQEWRELMAVDTAAAGTAGMAETGQNMTERDLALRAAEFDRWFAVQRPVTELTKEEIVIEARQIHASLEEMGGRLDTLESAERLELRDQMKPLAVRENALRDEYLGRVKAESRTVSQTWLEREATRLRESPERAGVSIEEIALAEAYYNGRREGFNSAREDFLEHHPERANDIPPAIEIQEIRVRQRAMEVEPEGHSMEIAS